MVILNSHSKVFTEDIYRRIQSPLNQLPQITFGNDIVEIADPKQDPALILIQLSGEYQKALREKHGELILKNAAQLSQVFLPRLEEIDYEGLDVKEQGHYDALKLHMQSSIFYQNQSESGKGIKAKVRSNAPLPLAAFTKIANSACIGTFIRHAYRLIAPLSVRLILHKTKASDTDTQIMSESIFNESLRMNENINPSITEMAETAQKHLLAIEQEMDEIAKQIDPSQSREEIVRSLKSKHLSGRQAVRFIRNKMDEVYIYLRQQDFIDLLGADQPPRVVGQPGSMKEYARASYTPGADQVTVNAHIPMPQGVLLPILIHEAGPGHRIQIKSFREPYISSEVSDKLSVLRVSDAMLEGWAVYTQKLMLEQGFVQDKQELLMNLYLLASQANALIRACRLILDPDKKPDILKELIIEEMEEFPVEKAQEVAVMRMKNYIAMPLKGMSYFLGLIQILQLRNQVQLAEGEQFSLKDFHRRLLSAGPIPVSLAAKLIFNQTLEPITAMSDDRIAELYKSA